MFTAEEKELIMSVFEKLNRALDKYLGEQAGGVDKPKKLKQVYKYLHDENLLIQHPKAKRFYSSRLFDEEAFEVFKKKYTYLNLKLGDIYDENYICNDKGKTYTRGKADFVSTIIKRSKKKAEEKS